MSQFSEIIHVHLFNALKNWFKLKIHEKLPVELFFKVTAERDYGLVSTGEIKIFLRISCERRYNPVSENDSNNLQKKNNLIILLEIIHLFSWE